MLETYRKGTPLPEHLAPLWRRFNPTIQQEAAGCKPWTEVMVDPDSEAKVWVTGIDAAGRQQAIYSPAWTEQAKADKFDRVRVLLAEYEDVRTQIESDVNRLRGQEREAALVAHLIYCTGIRPGSKADTKAKVQAFGATTLQLRHVKPCPRGVRLQFVGKKGVAQNVLVTDPYLVEQMLLRKAEGKGWSQPLFRVNAGRVNQYIAGLGSGEYTAKDFRTARGTSLALEILGPRKRLPKAKSARMRIVNAALDRVAKALGNTRAVSRKSYVDPLVLERFLN